MKKTFRKTIAMLMSLSMLGSLTVPVSATSIVPEDAIIFESVEDVQAYYESINFDFGEATEEEIQEFYQTVYEISSNGEGLVRGLSYDEEIGVMTNIYTPFGDKMIGTVYDEYGVRYMIHNNEAYICGTNETNDEITEYVIPDEIDGYPVVAVGSLAFANKFNNLEKIVIPNTVKKIGRGAFQSLDSLKTIAFSHPEERSQLQYLASNAFWKCVSLEEVTCFENSDLNFMDEGVFSDCTSLRKFVFPNNPDLKFSTRLIKTSPGQFENTLLYTGDIVIPSSVMKNIVETNEENIELYDAPHREVGWELDIADLSYIQLCHQLGIAVPGSMSNLMDYMSYSQYNKELGEWETIYERPSEAQIIEWSATHYAELPNFYPYIDITFTDDDFIDLKGDIDFDGEITISDLGLLKQAINKTVTLSKMQEIAISSENTTSVDIRDVTRLNQYLIKQIDTLD